MTVATIAAREWVTWAKRPNLQQRNADGSQGRMQPLARVHLVVGRKVHPRHPKHDGKPCEHLCEHFDVGCRAYAPKIDVASSIPEREVRGLARQGLVCTSCRAQGGL